MTNDNNVRGHKGGMPHVRFEFLKKRGIVTKNIHVRYSTKKGNQK